MKKIIKLSRKITTEKDVEALVENEVIGAIQDIISEYAEMIQDYDLRDFYYTLLQKDYEMPMHII